MKFDIIIPSTNVEGIEPLVLRCLRTIREYSTDYRLIFVQNGGELYDGVATELWEHSCTQYIKNQENIGFVKAVNQGLIESTAPYAVIMNNDTEATAGWLEGLCSQLVGSVGLAGPRSTPGSSWQGSLHSGSPRKLCVGRMLCFFCVMIRRDVLDRVGLLDEDFGVGFGDDDNYSARAQSAGFDLVFVPNVFIPHRSRTTFNALYTKSEIQDMQDEALLNHFGKLPEISLEIKAFQDGLYRNHMKNVDARRASRNK